MIKKEDWNKLEKGDVIYNTKGEPVPVIDFYWKNVERPSNIFYPLKRYKVLKSMGGREINYADVYRVYSLNKLF